MRVLMTALLLALAIPAAAQSLAPAPTCEDQRDGAMVNLGQTVAESAQLRMQNRQLAKERDDLTKQVADLKQAAAAKGKDAKP